VQRRRRRWRRLGRVAGGASDGGAGGNAVANCDDIATPGGAQRLVDAALPAFGRFDILINYVGTLRDKTLIKMVPADFETVVWVHLLGSAW
jgi:NAD(P)-dependent dehydrogenase (short-subunit alcohol dehydrogenase family)